MVTECSFAPKLSISSTRGKRWLSLSFQNNPHSLPTEQSSMLVEWMYLHAYKMADLSKHVLIFFSVMSLE